MNFALLLCWMYDDKKVCLNKATDFYDKLYKGVKKGYKFPFDCPYGVYLLSNRKDSECVVAVVSMRGTEGDDSIMQTGEIGSWLKACGAKDYEDRIGKPIYRDIQSTLSGLSYDYLKYFGTVNKNESKELMNQKKWWQFWK